jgi:hypothetical protein
MTLLAFGCSVTHGDELAGSGNNPLNIPFSYPGLIAQHMGVECINRAFCGNSNENIFHDAMSTIPTVKASAVIVGWTSMQRETWHCEGRTWQFIPSWAGTFKNVWKPFNFYNPGSRSPTDPQRCTDVERYMPILDQIYDILLRYKFDQTEYAKKQRHYRTALQLYCREKNVRLIETCWADSMPDAVDFGKIGDWFPDMKRHPNQQEHKEMARQIIEQYQL